MGDDLPALPEKPSLLDYLEQYFPFKLPRIPLPQAAKNLDKAAARLLDAGSINLAARMSGSSARIRSQSRAETDFIAAGSKAAADLVSSSDPTLANRAIEHALGDAVLAQRNREAVLEIAGEEISSADEKFQQSDATGEIDDDWLNMFAQLAASKSNRDIQSLWGKILAGEIRQPGSFSLRAMANLATLTSEEANFIYRFMPLVINKDFIFCGKENEFVNVDESIRLEELGVITGAGGLFGRKLNIQKENVAHILIHTVGIEVTSTHDETIKINHIYFLTTFGKQLLRLCSNVEPDRKYVEVFANSLISKYRTIHLLELGQATKDGVPVLSRTQVE